MHSGRAEDQQINASRGSLCVVLKRFLPSFNNMLHLFCSRGHAAMFGEPNFVQSLSLPKCGWRRKAGGVSHIWDLHFEEPDIGQSHFAPVLPHLLDVCMTPTKHATRNELAGWHRQRLE